MLTVLGLKGFPLVKRGDRITDMIVEQARRNKVGIRNGDVLVIAQKIVSKAEGRVVRLEDIRPSERAICMARRLGKDPRHVEAALMETKRIVRLRGPHLIVQTRHGFVCANAGVDRSNVEEGESVSLLPLRPDLSARKIRRGIKQLTGADVAVIISDTFGRPWRIGQVNIAIGLSGMRPWRDYRGLSDMFGYKLSVTMMAVADELASAAELVMNKADGVPVAIIRGYGFPKGRGSARQLIRPAKEDLFR